VPPAASIWGAVPPSSQSRVAQQSPLIARASSQLPRQGRTSSSLPSRADTPQSPISIARAHQRADNCRFAALPKPSYNNDFQDVKLTGCYAIDFFRFGTCFSMIVAIFGIILGMFESKY